MISVHDRIALELGRAIMRAHAAEAMLGEAQATIVTQRDRIAELEPQPSEPSPETAAD